MHVYGRIRGGAEEIKIDWGMFLNIDFEAERCMMPRRSRHTTCCGAGMYVHKGICFRVH